MRDRESIFRLYPFETFSPTDLTSYEIRKEQNLISLKDSAES